MLPNHLSVTIAKTLSLVFNPLILLFPVPFALLVRTSANFNEAIGWTFFTWVFYFIIGIFVLYEIRRGNFSNIDVSRREQRPLLFHFAVVTAVVYMCFLLLLHGPNIMIVLTLTIIFGLFVLDLLNTKIKVSIHVAAITSIMLAFVSFNSFFFPLLFCIPLVAWSRIILHRHSVAETVTGAIFGAFQTVVVYGIVVLLLHY